MSSVALIEEAQGYARELVLRESRGPGDTDNAMRRLEAKYGVPHATFWSLRYRPPKRIFADIYLQLKAAYETERERQLRKLKHEIEISRTAGAAADRVRAAEALVRKAESE